VKSRRKLMTISLLVAAFVPAATHPQEAFQTKELLQKDLHAYAGGDLVLSVGEITIAPGASGSGHRRYLLSFHSGAGRLDAEPGCAPAGVTEDTPGQIEAGARQSKGIVKVHCLAEQECGRKSASRCPAQAEPCVAFRHRARLNCAHDEILTTVFGFSRGVFFGHFHSLRAAS
jgi:hypothetical protein